MPTTTVPRELVSLLASPQTTGELATDALEEWILHRRSKGDTLFEVSVGLAELEDRTPPGLSHVFGRARYATNTPEPTDLTPPTGPFPLSRSASTETVLHHLLSSPTPTLEHSREVILEYVLARETKLKDKKPGRGGKGTLGREGFEDISKRLGEVEEGLRGVVSPRDFQSPHTRPDMELDESRQIGMTLILSLRLSLSYFTLQELAEQLLKLSVADAERTIVQHIRRRSPGEGRWGVGKELETVEEMTLSHRLALRPAFRSAKIRTGLPQRPHYVIALPAASKTGCIKLLSSVSKNPDATTPISPPSHPGDKAYFGSRWTSGSPSTRSIPLTSPKTPMSAIPPSSPRSRSDPNAIASYALELVSEYLTREKREAMAKVKWAKSGRDQLGKDLGEIEAATCQASKHTPTPEAQLLLPVFLVLRRIFSLPPSPLPAAIVDPYMDILPAPPDPDGVPFRAPTVQTTTAALYVNPRLDDAAALEVLEELIESEKEDFEGTREQLVEYIDELIDSVAKRFPDGSYSDIFALAKGQAVPTGNLSPGVTFGKQPSIHRRSKSHVVPTAQIEPDSPESPQLRYQHTRSVSMPMRGNTYDTFESDSDSEDDRSLFAQPELPPKLPPIITDHAPPQLPPLAHLSPDELEADNRSSGGGWWDVISAVSPNSPAPWHDNPQATTRRRTSSIPSTHLPLPPGAEPAQLPEPSTPYELELNKLDFAPPTPPRLPSARSSPGRSPGRRLASMPTPPLSSHIESPIIEQFPIGQSRPSPTLDQQNYSQAETPVFERPPPAPNRPPPIPANFSRPSFPSSRDSDPASPSPVLSVASPNSSTPPPSASSQSSKSNLFGRSMSLASKSMAKARGKDSDKTKDSGSPAGKVQNSPGRWDKGMVANIMGPPIDKRA